MSIEEKNRMELYVLKTKGSFLKGFFCFIPDVNLAETLFMINLFE